MKKGMLFLLLLLASFLFIGCTSEEENISRKGTTMCNGLNNPFAYIGELHNECMDSLLGKNMESDSVDSYVLKFTKENHTKLFSCYKEINKEIPNYKEIIQLGNDCANAFYPENSTTRASEMLQDNMYDSIPTSWKSHILYIEKQLESNCQDSVSLDKAFGLIDSCIISDKNLNAEGIQSLLCISSIAKSTYKYNILGTSTRSSIGARFIEADFWGAVGGVVKHGIVNGFRGLMFGPEGVVCGVAGSAFLGAAIGSGLSLLH